MGTYVRSIASGQTAGAGSSFTPEMPVHVTGQFLLAEIANDGGGTEISLGSSVVTITNASPAVFTYTGADIFADGDKIVLTTSGTLPTGLTNSLTQKYFVKALNTAANTFEVSLTAGGASVNTSSAGSGTHTAHLHKAASNGWEMIGYQAASGASRSAFAFKVAASSAEAAPTFTLLNDDAAAIVSVYDDIDATTPVHGFARGDYSGSLTANSPALTTTNDNCLLIYGWNSDATPASRVPVGDLAFINEVAAGSSAISAWCGWRNQYVAGAAPTVTQTRTSSTNGGNYWVIALNNATGGGMAGEVRPNVTVERLYGTGFEPGTYSAPNAGPGIAALDGVNMHTVSGLSDGGVYSASLGTNVASVWVGGWDTFAAKNLAGKIISVRWVAPGTVTAARVDPRGLVMGLADSAGNYKIFRLARNKYSQIVANNAYVSYIDVDGGETYAASGALNTADIVAFGFFYCRGTDISTTTFSIGPVYSHGTMALIGANAATPGRPSMIAASQTGWGVTGSHAVRQGSQQLEIGAGLQIGNGGTTVTHVDFSDSSVELPRGYVDNYLWNVAANKASIVIKAGANDVIGMTAGVFATDTPQLMSVHADSSLDADYSFNGRAIVGFTFTDNAGLPYVGTTFKRGGTATFKNAASLTNCTISETTAGATEAAMAVTHNGVVVTGSTIDLTGTAAGYHLELGASVTAITLADVTFSGTPGTDKVHVLATTGTVTITISGTTSLAAGDVTSAGATVVISAPVVYSSVVISGLAAGYRVQIYDTTNNVELSNSVSSGSSVTWTDSVAYVADRNIRVRIAYTNGATAKQFIEAAIGTVGDGSPNPATLTYLANVVNDTTYNTNAINGSAVTGITFTDAATDLVNINLAGGSTTWPTIYAAFVYWISTATGIADDIAYISAPDTANYLLTSMKVKNTSSPSVPLTITGGYGRDATSGSIVDIVDTSGGNVYPLVDHVVAYATGSGVTAQNIADIAAASATATAASVTNHAKTLTVSKFIGLK